MEINIASLGLSLWTRWSCLTCTHYFTICIIHTSQEMIPIGNLITVTCKLKDMKIMSIDSGKLIMSQDNNKTNTTTQFLPQDSLKPTKL